ncbi:uncharacterized protein C8A04DRAFT_11578, partial [Dichotomopilus funicola]
MSDDSGIDNHHAAEKEETSSGNPPYRNGQIGVYKPFPRFDQASRSIVSDNWRASASLAGKSQTKTSNDNKLSLAAPSSTSTTTLFSPARSPLTAPIDSSIAGFAFNPKPPHSTPASVSTPVSGRGVRFDLGSGHVHHTSLSSVDTAASSGSQTQTTQLQTTQTQPTTSTNKQPVTFTVTITPDTLGYCFVRPDGTRTRLVPVDMLPFTLEGIPAREGGSGSERESGRLVELPVPGGVGEDGRSSNWQVLRAVTPPSASSGDVIQVCPIPTSSSLFTPSSKRMKVYCDKWVHEGVCAFTQQGCKYKHEMPADRATQHQLGLFLGYPAWWKRRQGELARV